MALTRKFLAGLKIDEENIDLIIDAYTNTMGEVKAERDGYKAKAEKLDEIQKQLDEANEVIKNSKTDAYKLKYEAVKEEFETFKNELSAKQVRATKESAYADLLKQIGVSEKRIGSILKISDIESIELNDDGSIVNASDLANTLKTEWSDFIVVSEQVGAETANPPANSTGEMTKEVYESLPLAQRMEYANAHPTEVENFN